MNRSSDGKTGSRERTPEANKKVVMAFYDAAINRKDFAGATQFIGGRYVQHNSLIADGLDGFKAFLGTLREKSPQLRAEPKRLFAEGDFVIVHTHGVRARFGDRRYLQT